MPIICPYCHNEIIIKDYDNHCNIVHPETIEQRAIMSIETAKQQVSYIYEKHPEAKHDNGLLLAYFAKGYPKVHYAEANGHISITAQYKDFFYFLKRAGSITRLGRHIRQPKRTGEAIEPAQCLKFPIKTMEAVKLVFEKVPQARFNEGILCEQVLRFWQPKGISMHYDKITQAITLSAPKPLFIAVLRHLEGITRASRKLRSGIKQDGNSAIPERRKLAYIASTGIWASKKTKDDWLPNTYVPDSGD